MYINLKITNIYPQGISSNFQSEVPYLLFNVKILTNFRRMILFNTMYGVLGFH